MVRIPNKWKIELDWRMHSGKATSGVTRGWSIRLNVTAMKAYADTDSQHDDIFPKAFAKPCNSKLGWIFTGDILTSSDDVKMGLEEWNHPGLNWSKLC